jgi:hypothetical protein
MGSWGKRIRYNKCNRLTTVLYNMIMWFSAACSKSRALCKQAGSGLGTRIICSMFTKLIDLVYRARRPFLALVLHVCAQWRRQRGGFGAQVPPLSSARVGVATVNISFFAVGTL